jgi:hypothetical protein
MIFRDSGFISFCTGDVSMVFLTARSQGSLKVAENRQELQGRTDVVRANCFLTARSQGSLKIAKNRKV